jgi:predicted SprT family Zn-dependent metalloprotease
MMTPEEQEQKRNRWFKKRYDYVCLDCGTSSTRRATSGHNGAVRRCINCRSANILREDHPLLNMKKV